jgi:hypothetical protein
MGFNLAFKGLNIVLNSFVCWLEDLLLISGGDLFEGEVFSRWSMYIRRGGNGI